MSKDLDKLAAELRKMKPSKSSRQNAMDAAMSAFSDEFASEKMDAKTTASEKNTAPAQGSTDAARPTGQTTRPAIRTGRVRTFGRQTVAKFNALTNFKPQTMMMAGTCAAALIAGIIVFPVMGEMSPTQQVAPASEVAQADSAAAEDATSLKTQSARAAVTPDAQPDSLSETSEDIVAAEGVKPAEITHSGGVKPAPSPIEKEAIATDIKNIPATEPKTNVAPAEQAATGPEIKVVERRVLKTPARTTERSIPAVTKIETRRVVKTPASTLERRIPAITGEVSRDVEQPDGTFETVTETVVLEPAGVEYVTVPAEYETYAETVVAQEASTELVTIPATFETIRETIEVQPDGTEKVLSSEVLAPPLEQFQVAEDTVVVTAGRSRTGQSGITAVDELLAKVRNNTAKMEPENRQRVELFQQEALARARSELSQLNSTPAPQTLPAAPPVVSAAPPPPPPPVSAPITAPAPAPAAAPRAVEKFAGLTLEVTEPEFKTVTETYIAQNASSQLVTVPATFETVKETVVVQEASTELVVIPGKYEWVDGDVEGSAVELEKIPPTYETISEIVVVQEASTELVTIPSSYETVQETVVVRPGYIDALGSDVPPVTKQISRRVIKTPASTQERTIPAVTKTQTRRVVKTPATTAERVVPYEKRSGKTRVQVTPATTQERTIPAVTKEVTRRVIKTPARVTESTVPAVPTTIERQVIAVPSKLYLRDDDGNIVEEFDSRDAFEIYKANLPTAVAEKPVSTFSVDVDTASYAFMRASINAGKLPPRASIRLEEMINYFPYDYEAPTSADEPFKANVTVTSNPWNADKKLMHIGIKGYVPPASEKPRSNLVFLIDTSGSMNRANKLPLLVNSFKLLLNTLDEDDTVSIVAYASASGTVLEPTRVKDKDDILKALNKLRAGGSTAGAAGLELAYQKAQENFDDEGVNRVILATDGDFNVGFSSPDDMKTFIQEKRETGIFLSVLGFGMGNYNDHLMQSLAQNGNGVAAYIDSLSEANKVLANEAGSALFTIAKDVKIQVEFNPATVAEYRLIGYETRALKRQDFNNDKVDAGEIGAGHTVTAIYEMTPVGSPAITVDKLRYVAETPPANTGSDEYAFVKIRHKLPNADKSTLQTFPIGPREERRLSRASDDMRFATAVAAIGQKLRGDTAVKDYSYEDALTLAKRAKGDDDEGYRAEFIQLVKLIETMDK